MEELADGKSNINNSERELAVNQIAFEEKQRQLDQLAPEIRRKENLKNKIFSWGVLGVVFLFLVFLAWKMFF